MTPFQYPGAPHRRRHGPRGYADLQSFRPWLRDEFDFRCVYCLLREQWGRMRAGFALDHFLPVSVRPEYQGRYDNLLYACIACNQTKGSAVLPDPTQVLTDQAVHVHEDGRLEGRTPEADRLIRQLGLDTAAESEARLLWQEIIALAGRYDRPFYQRLWATRTTYPTSSAYGRRGATRVRKASTSPPSRAAPQELYPRRIDHVWSTVRLPQSPRVALPGT